MSITGSIATFSSGLPTNIGVGDVLKYDGSNVAFIHYRYSPTRYLVRMADGSAPADAGSTTTWNMYRAYTSLANAEAQTENATIAVNFDTSKDLTAAGGSQMHWALYADAASW